MSAFARRSPAARFPRWAAALSLRTFLLLLLASCGNSHDPPAPKAEQPAATGGLTFGLLPERNVFEQKKRYQPLQDYLSKALGMPVNFKLLDNYQLVFSEILEKRIDGAFFGSMNGAIAQMKGAVEILARPVDLLGVSTYSGFIFTKQGSGISVDPRTWRGKRIALVNKVTTAGYLYPLALLRQSGFQGEPETFFSRMTFTGSHDAVILSVFNGEHDLGACKNTIFEEYARIHPEIGRSITVLTESSQVPSNGLGVRSGLTQDLKRRIKEALLGMDANENGQRALRQFQAQRFIETALSDYQPVADMARQAGLDLASWPLRDIH